MPELTITDLACAYGPQLVLEHVSLACSSGERLAVLGPNGAGKSTLLKAVVGLVAPVAGTVALTEHGAPAPINHTVAYLPQRTDFDPDYPAQVRQVVAMGRYPHVGAVRRLRPVDHERIEAALVEVGLDGLATRRIGALSGGQQQRMFLARALAQEARVLLLDEPYAGIDATAERIIDERLSAFTEDGGIVVLVNHDLASLSARESRLVLLHRSVIADGSPSEVLTRDALTRAYGEPPAFLGAMGG